MYVPSQMYVKRGSQQNLEDSNNNILIYKY